MAEALKMIRSQPTRGRGTPNFFNHGALNVLGKLYPVQFAGHGVDHGEMEAEEAGRRADTMAMALGPGGEKWREQATRLARLAVVPI